MDETQPEIITFDFDGTLTCERFLYNSPYSTIYDVQPHYSNIEKIKQFKEKGARVYIVTRRLENRESIKEIGDFVRAFSLPIDGLYFTNFEDKVHTLLRLGSRLHHDDDIKEIVAIKQYAPHIQTVLINT